MRIIGVTGGSGSGKSMLCALLRERGVFVIDADELYRELLTRDENLNADIKRRFPAVYRDGALDRKALGRVVFSDAAALRDLNAITHPYVTREIEHILAGLRERGTALAAIEAIALIECGAAALCDRVAGVIADRDIRISRIMARDGIDRHYAALRIDAQQPDDYFRAHCDMIIVNNGGDALQEAAAELSKH